MTNVAFFLAICLVVSSAVAFRWIGTKQWIAVEGADKIVLNFGFILDQGEEQRRIAWFKNTTVNIVTLKSYVPSHNHWYTNSSFVGRLEASSKTGELTLMNVALEDSGQYVCALAIEFGNGEEVFAGNLWVRGQPPPPSISLSSATVHEGDEVNLTCTSQGSRSRPANASAGFLYLWFKDSSPLEKTWHRDNLLTQKNLTKKDAGNYACAVKEDVDKGLESEKSETVLLEVKDEPGVIVTPVVPGQEAKTDVVAVREGKTDVVAVREGTPLTLTCDTTPENYPFTEFKWSRPRNGTLKSEIPGKELNISRVTKDDAGNYSCQATFETGGRWFTKHAEISVDVIYLRSVEVMREEGKDLTAGNNFSFRCRVDGSPGATLARFLDDTQLSPPNGSSVPARVPADACGTMLKLKCQASIEAFRLQKSKEVSLPVQCAPYFPNGKAEAEVKGTLDKELTLFRVVANPAPQVDVLEGNLELETRTDDSSVVTAFTLPRLKREHLRTHSVRVRNMHGSFDHSFSIVSLEQEKTSEAPRKPASLPTLGLWTTLGVVMILSAACFIIIVIVYIGRRTFSRRHGSSQPRTARGGPGMTEAREGDAPESEASDSRSLETASVFSSLPDLCRHCDESSLLIGPHSGMDDSSSTNPPPFVYGFPRLYPTLPVESSPLQQTSPSEVKHQSLPGAIRRPLPPPPLPDKQKSPLYVPGRWNMSCASPYMYMGPLHAESDFRDGARTLDIRQGGDDEMGLPAMGARLEPSAPWLAPPGDSELPPGGHQPSPGASDDSHNSALDVSGPASDESTDSYDQSVAPWMSFPRLIFAGRRLDDDGGNPPALMREQNVTSTASSSCCPPAGNVSVQRYENLPSTPSTATSRDVSDVREPAAKGRARVPPPVPAKPCSWPVFHPASDVTLTPSPQGQSLSWTPRPHVWPGLPNPAASN